MNKCTIDVEGRFDDNITSGAKKAAQSLDELEKSANQTKKKVDNLNKSTVKPKLGVDDNTFVKKMDRADKKLSKFGKMRSTAKVFLHDKATSILKKVLSTAKSFNGKAYSATVKIRDSNVLSTLNKISNKGQKIAGKVWTAAIKIKDTFTAPLSKMKNMLFNIKTLILGIASAWAATKLIGTPIGIADNYSSAKISFSTLLGDNAGQQMMDDLDEFAKKTPFNTSNVITSAQKMLAMGWDPENIIRDLQTIGDAAASTGNLEQGLDRIVLALSQIKTKGRLSTEELNQLAESGIAAKAMLAEQLGYGTGDEGIAKMTKDLEDGAIASDKALAALLAGMQKYSGMMNSVANETASGLKSQIADAFEINVVRRWGQGLQDGAKRGLGTVLDLLDESEDALATFGDMVYDIGKSSSNWAADKLENAVETIKEITGTEEFQNASLGGKVKMLWKGVVGNPLREWWESTVIPWWESTAVPWLSEKAASIGTTIGKGLTVGLVTLFGGAEMLAEGESGGASIAGSFVQGFKEGFDGSVITEAFVNAISGIWGALPWWAKILIGGYGVGKLAGGIASFAGGLTSFFGSAGTIGAGNAVVGASGLLGLIGKTGVAGVGSSGILGTMANAGYSLVGGTSAFTMGGGTAALIGGSSILGGLAGGASVVKGGVDLYQAYKAHKEGNETERDANLASGGSALTGVAAGAGLGMLFGGPIGALIGAGIGGIAGWWSGNSWADDIRETAAEAEFVNSELAEVAAAVEKGEKSVEDFEREFEKIKCEAASKAFGDISLSMDEIARLSKQIVFGKDLAKYEKFATATQTAQESLKTLNAAGEQTDRWLWKAGLGVEFGEDEIASIKAAFDDYISSAKNYVENKHYEFTASAELLLDLESDEGKTILEGGNAYYAQIQEQLNTLGTELNNTLDKVLEDGVISSTDTVKVTIGGVEYEYDEQKAVAELQAEIAKITKMVADAEADAELTVIELKFGGGKLTEESFNSLMQATQQNLDSRLSTADAALEAQIANLNLRFPEDQRNSEEYQKQLQTLLASYNAEVESVTADVLGVELNILAASFSAEDVLGEDAVSDLSNILNQCIKEGITPAELSLDEIIELSGNPELDEGYASLIQDYLSQMFSQLDLSQFELIEVDGKVQLKLKTETETDKDPIETAAGITSLFPDYLQKTVPVTITPQELIQAVETVTPEDFNVPESVSDSVILSLNAATTFPEQVSILASEFGIEPSLAETIILELTGEKSVAPVSVTANELCPTSSVSKTIRVNITALPGTITDGVGSYIKDRFGGSGFRGGVFGGNAGSFFRGGIAGFNDGGMVRGGPQYIKVAEEGTPEMVIPLGIQRRERALQLWAKAGEMLGVGRFARGGSTDGQDAGFRFHAQSDPEVPTSGGNVQVDVGDIHVSISVQSGDSTNVAEAIKAQANEIAETVAGVIADALSGQFENTPVRGGA